MEFGPGFFATFLYYFTSAAVAISFVVARSTGLGLETGIPEQFAAVGGLIAGAIGVYFNRTAQFSLSVRGRKKFLNELDSTLAQYGYQQAADISDEEISEKDSAEKDAPNSLRIYERSGLSKWLSGRIFVQIEEAQVTLSSRAATIRALKRVVK